METFTKIRKALDNYDPYGFIQVSAAQSVFVTIGLFLINFAYAIPDFNLVFIMPAFGLIATGQERSYNGRIRNMATFFFITVTYSILLDIVQNYRYLVVFLVGTVIALLYSLSKKYPFLLLMIPLSHVVAYTFLTLPNGGDWSHIYVFIFDSLMITGCTLALMLLFPRVYFFRVWLRSLALTLVELESKIRDIIADKINYQISISKHLIAMQDFAYGLSTEEYGFSARKLALRCMSFYTFITAVMYRYQPVSNAELLEIADTFSKLTEALSKDASIPGVTFTSSDNEQIRTLQKKVQNAVQDWNNLCKKL